MQISKEKLQTSMKHRDKLSQLKHSNITKTILPYKKNLLHNCLKQKRH